ncbi:nuclear transport factor 2 family protein [Maribacter halichondriae]|uniref:nuclear transport factor 2 family protein n=1 Tax=Maribacter halichondriae TaxID=2980554 RepID=UPI002359852B|nr:nuclear transport factor 2 family protein [Maribacter sp. Hal144]
MKVFLKLCAVAAFLFLSPPALGQDASMTSDEKSVHGAIQDYVDALYKVEPAKIERSVDPTLRKIGYWYDPDSKAYNDNLSMTYQQLYDLAGSWNKDGDRVTADSPQEITLYEVNDKTATGKLTAEWGIDLFHLAKVDDQWKIMNIIWQSPPKNK